MKKIIITGGSGKAGRHAVQHFLDHGYQVLNLDLVPLDHPKVVNLVTDITDSGQVFNALSPYTIEGRNPNWLPGEIAGIVHFAAIPRIGLVPDNETFRINTMGTYNILEAATKLGFRRIVVASSETVYGLCFALTERSPVYLPLDEDYPVDPMDSYALSKICNERTAQGFHRRTGAQIVALRIGNVISPEQYADFPVWFRTPERRRQITWSYIDARDLGQIARLAIETDGLGFQIINATADDNSSDLPARTLVERYFPDVPVHGELGEFETLLSNRRARDLLGFKQQHHWRDYVKD